MPIESIIPFLDADSLQPAAGTDLGTVVASSKDLGWSGVHVERGRNERFETDHVVIPDHYFVLLLSTELRWEARHGRDFQPVLTRQGDVMINPAHTVMSTRVPQASEFAILTVQPERLWQAVQGAAMPRPSGFEQRFQAADPLLRQLILPFLAEAERGGGNGRLFVDSLTTALAVHYIGTYGTGVRLEPPRAPGLDARRLKRATEYLDTHYTQDISLDALASEVAMSKFHLIRLFKQSSGLSPYQYVLKRRMDKGMQLLAEGQMAVSQVAYAVGFGDQSAFSSHFRKHFGRTPTEVRRG